MQTRTVRAETMLEALEQIKNEMGSDALIVSARQIPGGSSWQVWKKPMVEVVAVKPDSPEEPANPALVEPPPPAKKGPAKLTKKTETTAGKAKTRVASPSAEKPEPTVPPETGANPLPVEMQSPAPVDAKVRKAVFPEIKREKPAAEPEPAVTAGAGPDDPSSPLSWMEKLGIAGSEPEIRPEIEMAVPENFQPQAPPASQLEVIDGVPAAPVMMIEKFSDLIAPRLNTRPEDMWPLLAKMNRQLKNQELDEEILDRVTEVSLEMVSSRGLNDEKRIRDSLASQLEAFIHTQKESDGARQVICLVGVSGSGKTCLCAKLAVKYHNSMKKQVAWISADTIRTGAINESRTYADAIGIPLHTAYTPEELHEAVSRESIADVILVDMPSVNPRSEASVMELGSFLTVLQRRSTWIVAPATAKTSDMVNLAATLSPFRPTAIAVTKLDETNTFGSVFNLAWKTQLPLVYYSFGPRVMDEISYARADTLVNAMFTERFNG